MTPCIDLLPGLLWLLLRLPPMMPVCIIFLFFCHMRFSQLSILSGHLAGSNCEFTIHVILRARCISQSAGNCSTVNQEAENK